MFTTGTAGGLRRNGRDQRGGRDPVAPAGVRAAPVTSWRVQAGLYLRNRQPTVPAAAHPGGALKDPGDLTGMVTWRPGSVSVAGQRRADGADRKRPGGEAWGHSLGCRAAASREGGHSQRTTKAGRTHSLPLLTYSRPGGLRQAPGRAAESAAGPRTNEDMGAGRGCVVVDLWGTR